jgi:hypothetical protein
MKSSHKILFSICAALWLSAFAFAAEASPAGTWKWTIQGRQGGRGFEQTLRLDYHDGKLSGTLLGMKGERFSVPDTPITDASLDDGQIKFAVTREFRGNKFTTKYEGKLEGDTIAGSYERPGMNGAESVKRDWNATRVK